MSRPRGDGGVHCQPVPCPMREKKTLLTGPLCHSDKHNPQRCALSPAVLGKLLRWALTMPVSQVGKEARKGRCGGRETRGYRCVHLALDLSHDDCAAYFRSPGNEARLTDGHSDSFSSHSFLPSCLLGFIRRFGHQRKAVLTTAPALDWRVVFRSVSLPFLSLSLPLPLLHAHGRRSRVHVTCWTWGWRLMRE